MKFRDLVIGQKARIPLVHPFPSSPAVPAAVEILSTPQTCRLPTCEGWDVEARVIDTGEVRQFTRKPDFGVVLITEAAETKEADA